MRLGTSPRSHSIALFASGLGYRPEGIDDRGGCARESRSSRLVLSKRTRMYADCLILDQCRYFFDDLPTIDLIPTRFRDQPSQLVLGACLDHSLAKQRIVPA